jgi:proline dehydrogenase
MTVARRLLTKEVVVSGLTRLAAASPVLERGLWRRARRHVGGRDLSEALRTADLVLGRGAEVSFDLFGTTARDEAEVRTTTDAYVELARAATGTARAVWLSVDLSHLGLRWSRRDCAWAASRVANCVAPGGRLQIGAEEAALTDEVLAVVHALAAERAPVMATVQANLLRSEADAKALVATGIPIRLVKGAFSERADVAHAPGPAVNRAFRRLAVSIHQAGGLVSLATHDRALREVVFAECGRLDCEVSLGVRDQDVDDLVADGVSTRVYVPFGPHWLRFYLRRLAEAP